MIAEKPFYPTNTKKKNKKATTSFGKQLVLFNIDDYTITSVGGGSHA